MMILASSSKESKSVKLSCGFIFDGPTEPKKISLQDCSTAIGIKNCISGYFGSFSQQKGFKPIREAAHHQGKEFTMVNYIITTVITTDGATLLLPNSIVDIRELTKKQLKPIYEEISKNSIELYNLIIAKGGLNNALTDEPALLSRIFETVPVMKKTVIIHTIKPQASAALVVATFHQSLTKDLVNSAVCNFNKHAVISW